MSIYDEQTWVDGEGGGTPINAERLGHIESGITLGAPAPDLENRFARSTDAASPLTFTAGSQSYVVTLLDEDDTLGDFSEWGQWFTDDHLRIKVAGWYRVRMTINHGGAAAGKYYTWGFSITRPKITAGFGQIDVTPRVWFGGVQSTRDEIVDTFYLPGPTQFAYDMITPADFNNQSTTTVTVTDLSMSVQKVA